MQASRFPSSLKCGISHFYVSSNVLCQPWHIPPTFEGLLWNACRHDFHEPVVPVGGRAVNIIFMEEVIPVCFIDHLTCFSVVCILIPPNCSWCYAYLFITVLPFEEQFKAIVIRICKRWNYRAVQKLCFT